MKSNAPFGREAVTALGLFLVLLVLTMVPQLTLLTVWLLPVPLIVFSVLRIRWFPAGLAVIAGLVLLLAGMGPGAALFAVGMYFIAWVMGESIRHAESPFLPLITGTLVLIMMVLVMLAFVGWSGIDIYTAMAKDIGASLRQDQSMLRLSDSEIQNMAADITSWIRLMIPSVLCVASFCIATVNLVLARWMVGNRIEKRPVLQAWHLPNSVVLVYVIALSFVLFGWLKDIPIAWQMMNNITFLAGFFIGIQGIAFLWRRMDRLPGKRVWLGIILCAGLFKIVGSIYILLGLMDSMNRARRR